ncbi:MAG: ATP-binding cassette domain-containing protein [Myxococcota bacterium]
MSDILVSVRDLALGYSGKTTIVVDELDIARGTVTTLLGPSGCGKSTLLDAINGLKEPLGGTLRWHGDGTSSSFHPSFHPPFHRMGRTFQHFPMLPWLRVEEHFVQRAKIIGARIDARESLARLGVEHLARRFPMTLSGGERARCAIALGLAGNANLLLLDEPFNGLDYWIRSSIVERLREIAHEEGIGMIVVTHELADASAISDNILILGGSPTSVVRSLHQGNERSMTVSALEKEVLACRP